MKLYLDEAAQALSRVLFIPAAHARHVAEELDDTTRESLHHQFEQCAHNLRYLVDAAQQALKAAPEDTPSA